MSPTLICFIIQFAGTCTQKWVFFIDFWVYNILDLLFQHSTKSNSSSNWIFSHEMSRQCCQILKANFWISTVCKFLLDFLLLWFYVKLTLGNLETFIGSEFWFHKLLHFLKAEKYYQIIIIQSPYNCKDGNFELLQSTKLISRKIWETENSWNWQHWYFFFKL